MHPYLTERMLRQSEALAPLGAIAVQHRERLDGSGYPARAGGAPRSRGRRGSSAPPTPTRRCASRVPHRPPRSADEAAATLRADVKAGRRDAEAVEAVLGAAGHRVARRREGPAGLTAREVEVLTAARPGDVEQGDRPAPRDLPEDGRQPHRAHLREDRRLDAGDGEPVRHAARACCPRSGSRPTPASRRLHRLRIPRHRLGDRSQILTGAELDVLGPRLRDRDVAGRQVEGVAGLEDLVAIGEAEGQRAPRARSPSAGTGSCRRAAPSAAAWRRCPARTTRS